jgi:hypothetical protein
MATEIHTALKQPVERQQPLPRQPIRQQRAALAVKNPGEGLTLLTNWKCTLILGLSSVACFMVLGLSMVMVAHIYSGGQVLASEKIAERAHYDSMAAEHESERIKYMVSLFKKSDKPIEQMGCPISPLYRMVNGKKIKIC